MNTDLLVSLSTVFSGITSAVAIFVTWIIYTNQKRLSQRQSILPLWDYLSTINEINSENPVGPDVIKMINTLELVSLLCEGQIIDEKIILRTFDRQFIKHYDQIEQIKIVPGLGKSGKEILNENPATKMFYKKLIENHQKYNVLQP